MYDEVSVAADGPAGIGGAATVKTTPGGEIVVPEYDGGALPAADEVDPAAPGGVARTQGSGFGLWHKFTFGSIMVGFFSSNITMSALRDVYAIKFHIGIGTMGTIQSVHNTLGICVDVAIGHMQDNEWFVFRLFNKERWGRRAPWVVLATPVMAVMSAPAWTLSICLTREPLSCNGSLLRRAWLCVDYFVLNPLLMSPGFLTWWYFFVVLIALFCGEQLWICNQAASAECYPFKDERAQLESFNLIHAVVGIAFACVFLNSMYKEEDLVAASGVRHELGVAALLSCMVSLFSAPALRDARQESRGEENLGFKASAKEALANDSFRILCLVNFTNGIGSGVLAGFLVYYYTFVARLSPADVATNIVVVPIFGLFLQAVCGTLWGKLFSIGKADPATCSAWGRLIDAAVLPWFFIFSTSLGGIFAAWCVHCVLVSPLSFWSITVRGWIVDEDAFANFDKGRVLRREALFSSVATAASKVAGIAGTAMLAGMALAGMDTTLLQECDEGSPYAHFEECHANSSARVDGGVSIDRQPPSAILYIRAMYIVVSPAFSTMCYFLIKGFPIKVRRVRVFPMSVAFNRREFKRVHAVNRENDCGNWRRDKPKNSGLSPLQLHKVRVPELRSRRNLGS
eukprot:COSAG02_NODE_316_length_24889_cov_9.418556_18_plen_628_part_00